jgi:excisionase family DNA binding protein
MRYLTVAQVCKKYSISKSSVFKLLRSGKLGRYRLPEIGRKVFINCDELDFLFYREKDDNAR